MTISVYSSDFDEGENVANCGFSQKIFVESPADGNEFKTIQEALDYTVKNNLDVTELIYYYKNEEGQMFKKFQIG